MIEIKYETLEKEVVTRVQDDNMPWKEVTEHFINLLPSMGYDGINTDDIIAVLHKYVDSTGNVRNECRIKPKDGDMYSDTPELKPHNYNMSWGRDESHIPDEHDDEDIQTIYTDMITDEEDY